MIRNTKAQGLPPSIAVFVGLLMVGAGFVILALLGPVLNEIIDTTVSGSSDVTTNFFIRIIPFALVMFLVLTAVYIIASRGGE